MTYRYNTTKERKTSGGGLTARSCKQSMRTYTDYTLFFVSYMVRRSMPVSLDMTLYYAVVYPIGTRPSKLASLNTEDHRIAGTVEKNDSY